MKRGGFGVAMIVLALGSSVDASQPRAQDPLPRDYGVQRFTPRAFRLPEGSGCAGDVARWQAVQANDYASGNVNLKIYNQIQAEIARASEACEAGRDADARKLVASSKSRHGYPQ